MKKRILSMILCLVMVLSLLPVNVIAEGDIEIVTDPTVIIQETTTQTTQQTTAAQQETSAPAQETAPPSQETSAPAQEPGASQETTCAPQETTCAPTVDPTDATEATTAPAEQPKVRMTSPAPRAACEHSAWTAVTQATGLPTASGNYILTESIELTVEWKIPSGVSIDLCLNGNSITQKTTGQRVINVAGGTLTVRDCTGNGQITGANVGNNAGAGVRVDSNGTFNFYGGNITGNTTTNYGGGVYVTAATFNMFGGKISANHATGNCGGGVSCNGNAKIDITGGVIENNTAKNGGGVYIGKNTDALLLENVTLRGNSATDNGGGVYVGQHKSVVLSGNVQITGNTKGGAASNLLVVSTASESRPITESNLATTAKVGISIYNETYPTLVSSGATSQTTSCYIPDNSAKAIAYSGGTLTMITKPAGAENHANTSGYTACSHGSTGWAGWYETSTLPTENGYFFLSQDVALNDTWKIANGENITLCLNGKTITAPSGERAIEVTNGTLNLCDCTKTGKITGADVNENGGALHLNGASAKANLYDITLSGNKGKNGGAICAEGKSALTVTGGKIESNTASAYGGGIYVNTGGTKVTLNGVTVTGNTTTSSDARAAGGVHVNADQSTTLSGKVHITGNTKANQAPSNLQVDYDRVVAESNLDPASQIGVSVFNNGGEAYLERIARNVSSATLGCYAPDDSTQVVQQDGTLILLIPKPDNYTGTHTGDHTACGHTTGNWITWNYGDKLPAASGNYCLGGDVALSGVWEISDGQTITLCLNGKTVTQTKANTRAILLKDGVLSICDCAATPGKITGVQFTSDNYGGAVRVNGGTFNLYGGSITGNRIEANNGGGAAVYVGGGTFNMEGGTVNANTVATKKGGGAIYLQNSTVNLNGGSVESNAGYIGGAVYAGTNAVLKLDGVTIKNNTAETDAGAIRVEDSAQVTFTSGELSGNFAPNNGGAVHVLGSFTMEGGKITGNGKQDTKYTAAGGAIAVSGGGNAQLTGGEISGNTAKNGAGLLLQGTNPQVLLKDITINGNTATDYAGGVYVGYDTATTNVSVTLSGAVKIADNTANGKASNLFFVKDYQVASVDALAAGAAIGVSIYDSVTIPKVIVASGADDTVKACFTSDRLGRLLLLEEDKLVFAMDPGAAHTDHTPDQCGHEGVTWTDAVELPTASGHYYLITDVELTNTWTIGSGKEITLCLNGHNIISAEKQIAKINGGVLHICDCKARTENGQYVSGRITGADNAANGAAILVDGGGALNFYSGQISGNKTTANGGAVYVGNGTAVLSGGVISGNEAVTGGGVAAGSNGKLTISGTQIISNTASKNGGGVILYSTEGTMTGGKIADNTGDNGGGIAVMSSSFTVSGGVILSNTANGGGGAIYAKNRDNNNTCPEITVSGGTIANNISKLNGGGIRVEGQSVDNRATLTISGGVIEGNTNMKTVDPETGEEKYTGDAGGVAAKYCSVTISGDENTTRIISNKSGNAAGILLDNSDATMSGGLISANEGTGNGPGVYASGASTFTMNGGSIRFNKAVGNGGGVFLSGATMILNGGEIRSNEGGMGGGIYNYGGALTVKGGEVKTNTAYKVGGGGIYSANNDKSGAKASLTIAGGSIKENSSKSDGGGVRVDSGSFKMTAGTIEGNKAKDKASAGGLRLVNVSGAVISGGKIAKNSGANAGGVYVKDSSLTISGGEISRNQATGSGAGLMGSSAAVTLSGGIITNNYAKGDAAGVYISGGSLSLCGTKVTKNQAEKVCGGILVAKKATFSFTSGEISGNTAKLSSGGVMVQTGARMTMTGGTVSGNITVNHGGGIYVNKDSALELKNGVITGNAARKSGGGIYVGEGSQVTISGGSITANDATTYGGGLSIHSAMTLAGGNISANTSKKEGAGAYINNVKVTMTGGTFDGNATEYNGGGICVRGEKGLLELHDGKIIRNKCKESGGGILVQGNGKLMMYGGEVCDNLAPNGGGGIRLHNCAGEIYGGKINGNTTYGQGAGIYSNLSLIIKDAEVCDNKIVNEADIATRSSAAIRTYNESTLVMDNVKVTGNTCDGRAGAIEIAYNVKADITNCRFEDNSATERGGTFSVYREGVLNLTDCTVSGNATDGNGGVFSLDPYGKITFTDCDIKDNTANVGAVGYVATDSRAVLSGCTVKGNTAQSHASVLYANGDVVLEDTVVTGNKDKRGGAAIYLDNTGYDTESFLPGVYEIKGNTVIHNNQGGDLVLVNNAFVNIPGDGLGEDAKIQVKLQDDDITRWIIGPYDYKKSGDGFLLTRGEGSLQVAFMAAAKQTQQPEASQEQQEQAQQMPADSDQQDGSTTVWIAMGAAVAAIVIAAVLVAQKKKKKQKAA